MHQSFTEPITPAYPITQPGIIDATLDILSRALDDAQERYNKLRNRNLSKAQYDFYVQVGLKYAVAYGDQWRKFYRNNVGERCDYEKLNKLFYKFYKLKQKELDKKNSWWHNI